MRSPSPPRIRHAAALLHLLLALALMLQALTGAASAAAGTMHRHGPETERHAAPLQVLVDFRRTQDMAPSVAHAQAERHHHGASAPDVVRTPEDQAADRGTDVADGVNAQLALLPTASRGLLPAATPPQVTRSSWTVTMHEPALPERPPRHRAPRSANA